MGNNLVKALPEAGYLIHLVGVIYSLVFLLPEILATLQRLGQQELGPIF